MTKNLIYDRKPLYRSPARLIYRGFLFGGMITMPATKAMIDYAVAISEKLHIDEPDFSDFGVTSDFISTNLPAYKKIVNNERFLSQLEESYGVFGSDFTDDFKSVLENAEGMKGIYVFWFHDEIVYIGKSINLQARIYTSLKERLKSVDISHVSIIGIEKDADLHIFEVLLITEYKPILNLDCACNDYSKYFKSPVDFSKIKKTQNFLYW